jgi:hypothetical protein
MSGAFVEFSIQVPFVDSQHSRYRFIPLVVAGFSFR